MRSLVCLSIAAAVVAVHIPAQAASGVSSRLVVTIPVTDRVSPADVVRSAKDVLVSRAQIPPGIELNASRVVKIGSTTVVKFEQTHGGLPVVMRGAGMAVRADGSVMLATARVSTVLPSSVTPVLDAAQAAAVAEARSGRPARPDQTRLVIWPIGNAARLAYIVRPLDALPFPYVPEVIVDANTGGVLAFENAVRFKNKANMYAFNPVKTPTPNQVDLPIPDPNTTPDNDDTLSFNCIDLKTVREITFGTIKVNIHTCELSSKDTIADAGEAVAEAFADAVNGDYLQYQRPADDSTQGDPFAQLSIFYHANKAYKFFRTFQANFKLQASAYPLYLVANLMMPPQDRTKVGDVNTPLTPFTNAFYTGWDTSGQGNFFSMLFPEIKGAALMFGQARSSDFSYDGDVVYHEFSHAVIDTTAHLVGYWHIDTQGATVSPGAMNEGLADFFSSAITGDPDVGEYAARELAGGGSAIRHINGTKTCPQWLSGEVHSDSEFFSSSIWKIRAGLASDADRFAFDSAIFTALHTVPSGDLGYEDMAEVLDTGVASSTLGATVGSALEAEFTARGVLPRCNRTIVYNGSRMQGMDPDLGYSFTAGGTSEFNNGGALSFAPGLFQAKVNVPAGAGQFTAKFSEYITGTAPAWQTGTPFKPAFLVKFDGEIAFDTSSKLPNTDTVIDAVSGTKAGNFTPWSADIPIPQAGATTAYVMVVNKGQLGSKYINIQFAFPQGGDAGDDAADADTTPDASSDAGSSDASAPAGEAPQPASKETGGCGCRAAGTRGAGEAAGAALLLIAAALVARRRR